MGASGTPGSAGVPTAGGSPLLSGTVSSGGTGGLPANGNVATGGATGGTDTAANGVASAATGTAMPTVHRRSASDNRRSNKPIMEKRRRARINNCLNELKALILDATKKDPARHSKLEKADILEMTVRHLETLRRQRAALSAAADPSVLNKYKAGFSECAAEVSRFLMRHNGDSSASDASSPSSPAVDQHFKRCLLSHLTHCLNGVTTTDNASSLISGRSPPPEPMDDSPSLPPLAPKQGPPAPGGVAPSQATSALFAATGLQLLPTRLPNGDLALVLPSPQHQRTTTSPAFRSQPPPPSTTPSSCSSQPASPGSPPPLLAVPAPSFPPSRTASTASCSSSASSSASMSPVAFEGPGAFALTVPRPCPGRIQTLKPVAVVAGSPVASSGPRMGDAHAQTCTRPLSPPLQKPLSLVMKRVPAQEELMEDEGPWRPW